MSRSCGPITVHRADCATVAKPSAPTVIFCMHSCTPRLAGDARAAAMAYRRDRVITIGASAIR